MQIDLQFICPSSIPLCLCLYTVHSEVHYFFLIFFHKSLPIAWVDYYKRSQAISVLPYFSCTQVIFIHVCPLSWIPSIVWSSHLVLGLPFGIFAVGFVWSYTILPYCYSIVVVNLSSSLDPQVVPVCPKKSLSTSGRLLYVGHWSPLVLAKASSRPQDCLAWFAARFGI